MHLVIMVIHMSKQQLTKFTHVVSQFRFHVGNFGYYLGFSFGDVFINRTGPNVSYAVRFFLEGQLNHVLALMAQVNFSTQFCHVISRQIFKFKTPDFKALLTRHQVTPKPATTPHKATRIAASIAIIPSIIFPFQAFLASTAQGLDFLTDTADFFRFFGVVAFSEFRFCE